MTTTNTAAFAERNVASNKACQLVSLLTLLHMHDEEDIASMGHKNHMAILSIASDLALEIQKFVDGSYETHELKQAVSHG